MNGRYLCLVIFICHGLIFTSCSRNNIPNKTAYRFKSADGRPDYSSLAYWAAHPWKWDPSDSVPDPIQSSYHKDSLADVFFLYPTSFTKMMDRSWNAAIDASMVNKKTDYTSMLYQASAFSEKARVFAPRYRQANLKAYFTRDTAIALQAFDLAYSDVKAAFEYYLANYNHGRPVIIAAHSQGTTHGTRLIKDFFESKPLKDQLICAYLIGMPVPDDHFRSVPPCTDSSSTGCYVSWRTYKRGFIEPRFVANEKFNSSVTNPLTWTNTTEYAPASLNKGGVLRDFNKVVPGVTDAQIHNNVLWSSKPKFFGNILLTTRNYHIADINLFYINIAENVKTRITEWRKKLRS